MSESSPKTKPKAGQDILLYSYTQRQHKGHARVKEVINEGLRGWIVETNTYLLIEVEPAEPGQDADWVEVAPKEPHAKH